MSTARSPKSHGGLVKKSPNRCPQVKSTSVSFSNRNDYCGTEQEYYSTCGIEVLKKGTLQWRCFLHLPHFWACLCSPLVKKRTTSKCGKKKVLALLLSTSAKVTPKCSDRKGIPWIPETKKNWKFRFRNCNNSSRYNDGRWSSIQY